MLSLLLHRNARPAPAAALSTRLRVEVCPPSLMEAPAPALSRWLGRLGPARRKSAAESGLLAVRGEFAHVLDEVPGQHAAFLQHRVAHCRSMRELWHLRPEIFQVLATQLTEHEANERLAPLNRHFPTRSPRSGFAPLDA